MLPVPVTAGQVSAEMLCIVCTSIHVRILQCLCYSACNECSTLLAGARSISGRGGAPPTRLCYDRAPPTRLVFLGKPDVLTMVKCEDEGNGGKARKTSTVVVVKKPERSHGTDDTRITRPRQAAKQKKDVNGTGGHIPERRLKNTYFCNQIGPIRGFKNTTSKAFTHRAVGQFPKEARVFVKIGETRENNDASQTMNAAMGLLGMPSVVVHVMPIVWDKDGWQRHSQAGANAAKHPTWGPAMIRKMKSTIKRQASSSIAVTMQVCEMFQGVRLRSLVGEYPKMWKDILKCPIKSMTLGKTLFEVFLFAVYAGVTDNGPHNTMVDQDGLDISCWSILTLQTKMPWSSTTRRACSVPVANLQKSSPPWLFATSSQTSMWWQISSYDLKNMLARTHTCARMQCAPSSIRRT